MFHNFGFPWAKLQQMNEFTNMYSYLKVMSQTNRSAGKKHTYPLTILRKHNDSATP